MYHPCQHNILLEKILENIPFFYVQNVFTVAEIKINILVYVWHIDQYSPIVISLFFLFSGNLILSQSEHNQQFRKKSGLCGGKKDCIFMQWFYTQQGKKKKKNHLPSKGINTSSRDFSSSIFSPWLSISFLRHLLIKSKSLKSPILT